MLFNAKNWLKHSLDLIYPRCCLYCEKGIDQGVLCLDCLNLLEFTEIKERCKRCFNLIEDYSDHPFCQTCFQNPSPFYRALAPLYACGPAHVLQAKLRGLTTRFISKGLAAFMLFYYLHERLPWPDVIVPIPDNFGKRLFQGHNASNQIAQTVAEILGVPIRDALRASGILETKNYKLKKSISIADKCVLLVGENMNKEFFAAGEALIEGCPHSILGAAIFTKVF